MSDNPLLKKIQLPGKRFRLPSRGLFYTDGEIAETVKDGELEIFSMTTIDEVTLRSPEFLFSGEAIERVFKRCIPDVKKPLKLLSKDVDFLLACLRIVSYGSVYNINTRCPECEALQQTHNSVKYDEFMDDVKKKADEQNVPFEIALEDEKVQNRAKLITSKRATEQTYSINLNGIVTNSTTEITDDESKKYHAELSNGQVVHLRPITMDSSVAAYQFQNEDNSRDLNYVEEFLSFIISCTVMEVDGITDEILIREWAKELPVHLKDEIETVSAKFIEWGTDFTYTVVCKDCSHERNISTLLNPITFFMTPSKSEEPSS